MKTRVLVTFFVLAAPSLASATQLTLFDPIDRGLIDTKVEAQVLKAVGTCASTTASRLGPNPAQQARCNAAMRNVAELGVPAGRAAMAHLDDDAIFHRTYLYQVVGQSGALEFVEPLVRALEREHAAESGNQRHYDVTPITRALTALTYATPKGTEALQWRAWFDAHRGMDRTALLRARQIEAEAQLKSDDMAARIDAGGFLVRIPESRERGAALLKEILERKDVPQWQRNEAEGYLYEAAQARDTRQKGKVRKLVAADPGA